MTRALAILTLLAVTAVTAPRAEAQTTAEADVVVVRMLESSATKYVFEPAEIEAVPGQTVRFVQEGAVPHNVEFKDGPDGSALDGIRMGPFLMGEGETYEVRIDERFTAGTYDYICTPHEMMGMKGKIVVKAGDFPAGPE